MAQPAIGGRLAAGGESVLTDGQLKRLAEHKYSSSGTTLMDPFMQRFWNWFVLRIPDTIAPNLLTITGLLVNAVTTLILILYSPDARHDVSRCHFFSPVVSSHRHVSVVSNRGTI